MFSFIASFLLQLVFLSGFLEVLSAPLLKKEFFQWNVRGGCLEPTPSSSLKELSQGPDALNTDFRGLGFRVWGIGFRGKQKL